VFRQTFQPGETVAIEATGTSARVALPRRGGSARITNWGERPVWLEFGGSAVTAAVPESLIVLPMAAFLISLPPNASHVAVISPTKPGSTGPVPINITLGDGM
jgi:hypothetical protein